MPGSAQALLGWSMASAHGSPVVVVADGPLDLERCAHDLEALAPETGGSILCYPPREPGRNEHEPDALDDAGDRNRALLALSEAKPGNEPLVVATCIQALMQPTPAPQSFRTSVCAFAAGEFADRDRLLAALAEFGYEPVPEVERKGQFSVRGGLLDLWSPHESWPYRLEFLDDRLESLRTFDPFRQRSVERREQGEAFPTGTWEMAQTANATTVSGWKGVPDFAPDGTVWMRLRADLHAAHAEAYAQTWSGAMAGAPLISWPEIEDRMTSSSSWRFFDLRLDAAPEGAVACSLSAGGRDAGPGAMAGPDMREAFRQNLIRQTIAWTEAGRAALFCFDTPGALDHFRQQMAKAAPLASAGDERLPLRQVPLSEGFVSERFGLMLVSESDLYGRRSGRRRAAAVRQGPARSVSGERLGSWTDIEPGDLVVHADHGLGRYKGVFEIVFQGQRQEVMTVEYAEGAKLHVPLSQAHLLSRYVGLSRRHAVLHRLGGRKWKKDKIAAQRAILDMAAQLLETQSQRNARPGYAFRPDHPWQREFEASFPYRETPDQARAIADVKADMESERPMDRLLCGDAGYGKTEVALRAAFKAALDGRQTAMLVPTTVLAQQHFDVFRERMAAYPVRVEMLSRFRSKKERESALAALADGSADIAIGTHALLQPSVRFSNLGLVIVDEEQRFGVGHKEWFKRMRSQVDMLTLTATPIPRTLYMSLTGARDMSLIQTPPSERVAVETRVLENSDAFVRTAILREVSREGQVFYLHNRVMTIERARRRLARLVPEARLIVAHGQMPAGELEAAMRAFTNREGDVLVCTTIIESGLDIPSVNTILIDRADRFGLADLYQLRGRVGRARHQGYACLLLPPHGHVDGEARQRIRALTENARLGAGFKLAVRDLEIRGAGNVLGEQQSGHIAAIGFDLYCQMLRRSVAELKGDAPPPIADAELALDFIRFGIAAEGEEASAFLPHAYMEDERLRLRAYRRVAETTKETELADLREEWRDRFGPLPPPAKRLLTIARIRIRAAAVRTQRIETRGDQLILTRNGIHWKPGGRSPKLVGSDPDAKLDRIADLLLDIRTRKP